ncbi:hypothetical protein PVOR_02786 [Paenibacillus vortex V453]|uniref:Uncharacterized protein n=1 Tax=Paenibacillus vortex V453 TaxID=715225 RepID=A0A2R9T1P2_9BACL|nr:hypothetical protein PVOR_02786 [Paenibacillus vortex V453]
MLFRIAARIAIINNRCTVYITAHNTFAIGKGVFCRGCLLSREILHANLDKDFQVNVLLRQGKVV